MTAVHLAVTCIIHPQPPLMAGRQLHVDLRINETNTVAMACRNVAAELERTIHKMLREHSHPDDPPPNPYRLTDRGEPQE